MLNCNYIFSSAIFWSSICVLWLFLSFHIVYMVRAETHQSIVQSVHNSRVLGDCALIIDCSLKAITRQTRDNSYTKLLVCLCVTMRPGRPGWPGGPTTQLQSSSSSEAVRFRGHWENTNASMSTTEKHTQIFAHWLFALQFKKYI